MNKHTPKWMYIKAIESAERAINDEFEYRRKAASKFNDPIMFERALKARHAKQVILEEAKDIFAKKFPKGKTTEQKKQLSHKLLLITGKSVEAQYEIKGGRPVPA
jgi:hypothetical protein